MQKQHRNKIKTYKIVGIATLVLLFFSILLVLSTFGRNKAIKDSETSIEVSGVGAAPEDTSTSGSIFAEYADIYQDEEQIDVIFYNGQAYTPRADIETVLLIGLDSYELASDDRTDVGFRNHDQSDVLMLFVIDNDEQRYDILQLNRDTMVDIDNYGPVGDYLGTVNAQLALSHTYGSGRLDSSRYTVRAVRRLLDDVDIDHSIAISMESIGILNDRVGGVTVTIPVDMSAVDPEMIEGAELTLTGTQAEYFVRSRIILEDSTNISRMERQRTYIEEWQKCAIRAASEDSGFPLSLVTALSDSTISDMSINELSNLGNVLLDYEAGEILTIDGTSIRGDDFMEFYPDQNSLREVLIRLFYKPIQI